MTKHPRLLSNVTKDAQPDTEAMLDQHLAKIAEHKSKPLTATQQKLVARALKQAAKDAQDIQAMHIIIELRENYVISAKRMPDVEGHVCGRPSASGRPCQAISHPYIYGMDERYIPPCKAHSTPEEQDLAQAISKAHYEGMYKRDEDEVRFQKKNKERAAEIEALRRRDLRTIDDEGHQIIKIGNLAYTWDGPRPLRVGDVVTVPGNWMFPQRRTEVVTDLGTTYQGDLQHVIQLVTPREEIDDEND